MVPLPWEFPSLSPADPQPLTPNVTGEEALKRDTMAQPAADPFAASSGPARHLWGWAFAAGLLAGFLTWVGGEVAWGRIRSARRPKSWRSRQPQTAIASSGHRE